MIIETKDDVVRLSGSLKKNLWMNIKAAANLLLTDHPSGIIVDCTDLDDITTDGAKTFLEAMRDIEAAKSRIIFVRVPKDILDVCGKIPGIRSQMPIAESIEEARGSLRIAGKTFGIDHLGDEIEQKHGSVYVIPLLSNIDLSYGAILASHLADNRRGIIHLIHFLEVPRAQPLNTPMPEEEKEAEKKLKEALEQIKHDVANATAQVERVRDIVEGILSTAETYHCDRLIFGAVSEPLSGKELELFRKIVDALIHRSPCEVIIGRQVPNK